MRNKTWLLAVLIAAIESSASASDPQFTAWQFTAGTGSRGTPYCGMVSAVGNKNVGQNIIIKGTSNGLVIDLYKDKWIRPQGSNVRVAFDFMDNQPLVVSAYADAHILDVEIPRQDTAAFLLQVAERPGIQVILPDDENEATWVISNRGAKPAVQKLTSCLAGLLKGRGGH